MTSPTGPLGSSPNTPPYAPRHEPVMLREAMDGLAVRPGGRYVDGTAGLGGHSAAIIAAALPGGRLLSLDRDPAAVEHTRTRLAEHGDAVLVLHGEFEDIAEICEEHGFRPVDGVLLDVGVSSMQLDAPGRGFSFQRDEPLDMRMDPGDETTASDIVNKYDERALAGLIYEYGEEPRSRRIARAIVERRPIRTTQELAAAVEAAVGRRSDARRHRGRSPIHPATLTFQALRIAVNRELEQLDAALEGARSLLAAGGRLVVISFHSLEDRRVKDFIRLHARDCICPPRQPVCTCDHRATLREVTRRPLRPSDAEVARNPRARSARLRVAEALDGREAA
ncbi:MAG: 16S rRNA (cytosine(1402)-N(4))-methyltransferase RsmH [Dehalococcoidia bacterium]|nr:16S rRNA (cytosine(1402)-N(4))-methyltransferase RsmH [Dehalococcoidia bacterium]